ncbi:MAG: geranylgeranylglyceryl/heptaprenylglyceryl phosphate synthase [Flavobacteriales bacterium]|nr:geranylgeranylglyceryl/heptaprenylglyceryl phosphate synthase [Flavobacteriales bacterium]
MARRSGPLQDLLASARNEGKKLLAVLLDPDKFDDAQADRISYMDENGADLFLIGGSLLITDRLRATIEAVRSRSDRPIYLFPSGPSQIDARADGILFLSLLSGRNAELLIGKQVEAAPLLKQTDLHVMSTGYMLVQCGNLTTAHYMSQSSPIPHDKDEIAVATAMAGMYLNMSCIYMDGGSGAAMPITPRMIESVRKAIDIPLIIGGGIRNAEQAQAACSSGADMIVVGTAFEEDPSLFQDISIAVHSLSVKS